MINQITFGINNMSQVLSFFLGILVLVLGTYVILTGNHPSALIKWSLSILGLSFVFTPPYYNICNHNYIVINRKWITFWLLLIFASQSEC